MAQAQNLSVNRTFGQNPVQRALNRVLYGKLLTQKIDVPVNVTTQNGQTVSARDVHEVPMPSFSAMRKAWLTRLPIVFAGDLLLRASVRIMTVFDMNRYVPWESSSVLSPQMISTRVGETQGSHADVVSRAITAPVPKGLTPTTHLWEPIAGTFKDFKRLFVSIYENLQSPLWGIAAGAVVLYHQIYSKICKRDAARAKLFAEYNEALQPDAAAKVMAGVQQRAKECANRWNGTLEYERSRRTFNDPTAESTLKTQAQTEISSILNADPELIRLQLSANRLLTYMKIDELNSDLALGILPSIGWSASAVLGVMYGLPGVVEFCKTMKIVESPRGFVVFLGSVVLTFAVDKFVDWRSKKGAEQIAKVEENLAAKMKAPSGQTDVEGSCSQEMAEVVVASP